MYLQEIVPEVAPSAAVAVKLFFGEPLFAPMPPVVVQARRERPELEVELSDQVKVTPGVTV
ncbi:MAG: hypothetical protein EBR01_09855 [Proteobacteria bacterium]|nr:hypothetical protein [Pseudomonadota bacterium]